MAPPLYSNTILHEFLDALEPKIAYFASSGWNHMLGENFLLPPGEQ
jgi:hypothetical protein